MANEPAIGAVAAIRAEPVEPALPRVAALSAGDVVGKKYRLARPAGFGGSGVVWVAKNLATDAEVAVKLLPAETGGAGEAAARFRREAHAAAKLSHRGIVRTFDLLELEAPHEGALLLVMELLNGETLADAFDRRTSLPLEEALDLTLALLSALSHAHAAGIVHRDLKPANVFLATDPDGYVTPKILDFGISKLEAPDAPRITGSGTLLGTPAYMSPEQARGSNDTDARSDLFSLGILVYEMLSGENPFASAGGSYHAVVAAILEREPPPLEALPPLVWGALAKALAKAPERRYPSADAFAAALTAAREGRPPAESIPAEPAPERAYRPPPARAALPTVLTLRAVRRRGRTAMLATFVGALAVAVLVLVWMARRPPKAEELASPPEGRSKVPEVGVDTLPAVSPTTATATTAATATATATGGAGAAPPHRVAPPRPPRAPRAPMGPTTSAPPSVLTSAPMGPTTSAPPSTPTSAVARDPGF